MPCLRPLILVGSWRGRVNEQLDAKPEQVGRPHEGDQSECHRVAGHQSANSGSHDQDGHQVAEQ
ncbi:hypothetical protein D3C80_1787320 [compost metagenome]